MAISDMKPKGLIQKIFFLLTRNEKRRGAIVLAMVTIMAILDTIGVASVMPFLSVLGNPDIVQNNSILNKAFEFGHYESIDSFLFALGGISFGLILFSALFRTLTHYVMNRFIEMRRHSIGKRLLETYLRHPYEFFLDRQTGDMAKNILSEVDHLTLYVFRPGVQMVAYGVVTVAIMIFLIFVDVVLAIAVVAFVGGAYALIFVVLRGLLGRAGSERIRANRGRFNAAAEALGGVKDIKLLGREHAYLLRFHVPSLRYARLIATTHTLSQAPKFLIEAIGLGGILALALVLLATQGGVEGGALGTVLPVLGLYAFAGFRLLPAAQQIYSGAARLRFGRAAVDNVYEDLLQRSALSEIRQETHRQLVPRHHIALHNLSFFYPRAPKVALKEISLKIPVGSSVGVIGRTGAGKTTLVDVILGLLRPSSGAILVDDNPVTDENLRLWQNSLGYVPQHIFLADSSVAENIALGVAPGDIDLDQVVRCAKLAQIHEFVMDELPEQYRSLVGERGIRLSGGQRQRIGIARALYHDPSILVFDEATSALDTMTESLVMESIAILSREKTIILIAHRESTVKACDQIIKLDNGEARLIKGKKN